MATLRLILGDQLSENITSLQDLNPTDDCVLMCELVEETTYVPHHKKKLVFFLSAMRHFAQQLQRKGVNVHYFNLDEALDSFSDAIERVLNTPSAGMPSFKKIVVTHPGEYRVLQQLKQLKAVLKIPLEIRPDHRFLTTQKQFSDWAKGRKQLRMELFYRQIRKNLNILMQDGAPVGGQWNYDKDNRKALPANLTPPMPLGFKPDAITRQVIKMVGERFPSNFGALADFHYAVTRTQALQVLSHFIEQRLPLFGDYQDAMKQDQPWLFHSHIGLYLNIGLLSPMEAIRAAEKAWQEDKAPLSAVEGFIRQILGWREFVRGLYWLKMPNYKHENFLQADRALPEFYWSGKTRMNCISQCVQQTKEHAYAHHIQRLMVLGNFALLSGLSPKEVNDWYLLVYADAIEWVELPNVSGMILFADAGYLASKPYAAGGAYINRMSDYCKHCHYKVKEKTGSNACPFNYLYWRFLDRNRQALKGNPRMALVYKNLERMSENQIGAIRMQADSFLGKLDKGEAV
ncbi:cryptochrome/photolyase family protein [Oceanospirillum sp.]|uniref:cryptochrome/photolyase family protein n=1 Tax=Oceanospirillum sp. TaxID=2021254 RepID=UPI003A93287F